MKHLTRTQSQITVSPHSQRGVTLVIALVLLMVVSLLGLSAMRSTSLEEKMASNSQDQGLAFQAAEAALRAGIEQITTAENTGFTDNCVSGYCTAADGDDDYGRWDDPVLDVWGNGARHQTVNGLAGVASQPRYIIEKLDYASAPSTPSLVVGYGAASAAAQSYYRITARGTGGSDTAVAVLQTMYVQ